MTKDEKLALFNTLFNELVFDFKKANTYDFGPPEMHETGIAVRHQAQAIAEDIIAKTLNGEHIKVIIVPFNKSQIG